jgi:hypothetical protein
MAVEKRRQEIADSKVPEITTITLEIVKVKICKRGKFCTSKWG